MKHLRFLFALAFLPFVHTTPAQADLQICNDSDTARAVAVGRKIDGKWGSEGWWIIDPGACKTPVKGALQQRYYYFRATTDGKAIHDGRYRFCTSPKPFTIEGQKDCADRGHDSALFERIDTGKDARKFTFRLPEPPKPKDEDELEPVAENEPAPQEPPKPTRAFAPGTYGEPYTVQGILQGCDTDDVGYYCAYHADGWKHFARQGAGTPDTIIREMELSGPGQMFNISGDMINYGDITVRVAVASFAHAGPDKFSDLREKMQGSWYSTQDDSAYFIIEAAEKKDLYDANLTGESYLRWADGCLDRENIGPVLIATEPENSEEPFCYVIVSVDDRRLVLSYVAGNGQDLIYERR